MSTRQLRRTHPLETEVIEGLTVPTLAEMARIKLWLLATRLAALAALGEEVDFEMRLPEYTSI